MLCTEETAMLQSGKRSIPSPRAAKKICGVILMELLLALAAGVAGIALLVQAKALPSEADAKKAKEKLDANPVDPDANTTYGKYTAFVLGDYPAAMPYLVHSDDKTLKTLAEHELDEAYTKSAPQKIGMGDEWVLAGKKFPTLARIFYDRAGQWYGQAWPDLDGLWKDRTRTQLRKLFQGQAAADPKGVAAPSGWKVDDATSKGGVTPKAARSGKLSYQVVGFPNTLNLSIPIRQVVSATPGKSYEFSAWVLSDGTNSAEDQVAASVFNQSNVPIDVKRLYIPEDQPWWHKVEIKADLPKGAAIMWVQIAMASKTGSIFVDDMSLKIDGKEVLKNPSFEDK